MAVSEIVSSRVEPEGFTAVIPAERYVSAEFAALEAEKLWGHVWQIAGREEEVPSAGDYLEHEIANESILVVRNDDGSLRAFHNACRHRGTQLRSGCGNAAEIRCRYHGWRWNLDGSLKEISDVEDFDLDCVGADALRLNECQVDVWGGFIFINMDLDAEPLEQFLGDVPEALSPHRLELMRFTRFRTAVLECNWKVALDAFDEYYHLRCIHPQMGRYLDHGGAQFQQYGIHGVNRWAPGAFGRSAAGITEVLDGNDMLASALEDLPFLDENDPQAIAIQEFYESVSDEMSVHDFFAHMRRIQAEAGDIDVSHLSDDDLLAPHDWHIFPNLLGGPGGLNAYMFRSRPNGLDPHTCLFDIWDLERPPAGQELPKVQREMFEDWRAHDAWGRPVEQDFTNVALVQKGMRSKSFDQVLLGGQERSIANFHEGLSEYLAR